ncbi:AMP-binding protein [Aeromicrobium sp.]|uniref:AMP-binding protein n=1 Tax=Aeromicrobium sp. TaxID=1871063 RepID=UPI0030C632A6
MITHRNRFAALRSHGTRPALISPGSVLTHADVADRVDEHHAVLTDDKRLVVVGGANTPEALIAYLSAMAHGHAVLLVPGDSQVNLASVVDAYDPDVVFDPAEGFLERRAGSRHALHPDLTLLLSTSGSTGSAKLVRLSHDNVVSNALSIADYLHIDETHRGLTTLPMHYCYGLSVVNSHLLSGAGLIVTDGSVVDTCLWDLAADAGATSFAGVPYTFDLLDSADFAERDLPSLRHITQAGGRLAPERIAAYARLGRQRGWDFFAMYGQTEATARMAYLPADLATVRPESLGVPIPGGSFRIEPVPESADGVGELVYAGPNVMMGYARSTADLARGADLAELRTGDLARQHEDGTYEWVGRRSRVAKVFGLRIDLDEVERMTAERGHPATCVSVGDGIQAFVDWHTDAVAARLAIAAHCGLPRDVVSVDRLRETPRTANGKVDHASLERQARMLADSATPSARPTDLPHADDVRDLFANLLGRPDATTDDSFTTLRGDSLSYVELSVRLGDLGIATPPNWHRTPIRELVATHEPRRRGIRLETSIVLRGLAILLVLGTHANLWTIPGGAHLLLAVVGYNFARFQLTDRPRAARVRSGLGAALQLALPCVVWVGAVAVVLGTYHADTVFLLNGLQGRNSWTVQWQFWFLEAVIWIQVATLLVLAVPWLHTAERREPFAFALVVLAGSLALRYALAGVEAGATERYTPSIVLWCFALGWAVGVASTRWQRIVVSLAAVVSVAGFFDDPHREGLVIAGVLVLVWVRAVAVPRWAARVLAALAAGSLYIYLTQWQIYPHLEDRVPLLAVLASVAGGLAYKYVWESLSLFVRQALATARLRRRDVGADGHGESARPGRAPTMSTV